MKEKHFKLIMELIFIFILPLLFICYTSEIQIEREFTYDNEGNYQVSEDTKKLSFDNSIIKYTNGYKNIIENFNILNIQKITLDKALDVNGNLSNDTSSWAVSDYIEIQANTIYYFKNVASSHFRNTCAFYDSGKNFIRISNLYVDSNNTASGTLTSPNDAKYMRVGLYTEATEICVNLSVNWANGNFAPYGEPLILYTQTDVSSQNDINYTIWGNLKNLLVDNLQLNNNILIDIILCYTILWFTMFIIWHFFYLFFDCLVHIFIDWGHKEKEKV